jgi:hypothetical protein
MSNIGKFLKMMMSLNRFLQVIDEFSEMQLTKKMKPWKKIPNPSLEIKLGKDSIVQFPNNHIPKGLIPVRKAV